MTKRSDRKTIAVSIAAAACAIILCAKPAQAQTDCSVPVTPPPGGFAALNRYAGQQVTPIKIEFTAYGDASFACVSNYQDFPGPDPQTGTPRYYCYPLSGSGGDVLDQWMLSSGYSTDKRVYVQYNRCAAPQPASVNAPVTIQVSYWPEMCSEVLTGTFLTTVDEGSVVRSPEIHLSFTSYGNASFVKVANTPTFPEAETMTLFMTSGFHGPINWTIPRLGTNTIYVKYFNVCYSEATSQWANVNVQYLGSTCPPVYPYGHYEIGSTTGNNHVWSPNVTLMLRGGNAQLVKIINGNNPTDLANAPLLPYSATMPWTLPPNPGSHTVTGKFCNACGTSCSPATSYTFVLH